MGQSAQRRHPAVVINNGLNPDYARSYYGNTACAWPVTPERQALARLKNEWLARPHPEPAIEYENYDTSREFLTIELDSYEIYASPRDKSPGELTSLESLDVRGKQLCLDGVLSIDGAKIYVQNVHIKSYSISGYGLDEEEEPETEIYIQSQDASRDPKYDIWYRLRRPGKRYKKFDDIFRWVSMLGKHVIDYLESRTDISVGLRSFQSNFYDWIASRYPGPANEAVEKWLAVYAHTDFRQAVHAHIDYLRQEVYNLNRGLLTKHHLFADCMRDDHKYIEQQELVQILTIATPHTYTCFKNRYFGKMLEEMQPCKKIAAAQEERKRLLGFPAGTPYGESPKARTHDRVGKIRVGDVVSITPSDEELRIWKEQPDGERPKEWFAYVRDLKLMPNGTHRLYVIWMYRPEDTTISTTDYPVQNELFLSDHCNCAEPPMFSTEVAGRCSIEWFATSFQSQSDKDKDYIVRQKYLTENSSFVTLSNSDLQCDCYSQKDRKAAIGDTVYVTRPGANFMDPVVVCQVEQEEYIVARRLLRYKDCADYPGYVRRIPSLENELVWSEELIKVPLTRVGRRCHIRYFSEQEIKHCRLPFPYDRDGAGDYWVLSTRVTGSEGASSIENLPAPPSTLHQAPVLEPIPPRNKLSGLSLFSGLGNLDKGLEQSGVVEFDGAVDMCPEAIHTLHANAENPEKLKLWLGSVDDYLATLLAGKDYDVVLPIGKIAVIAAGSPCPGFSTLQMNWQSESSLRNASHVTTICSFVDLYRPKWAFLENVVNMAAKRKDFESELVLSQLVACLVAMGYQVQQFIMSSWNYGSCQQRSRLILSIAAPGLQPIIPPAYTHSHPDGFRPRTVGELRNGQKFGAQEECLTPFPYVSANQAFGHLPDIGNGLIGGCVPYPDHRIYCSMNSNHRRIISLIPEDPPGLSLNEAAKWGLIPSELYQDRKEIGKAFRRIKKDGLVPTITTQPRPSDSRQGATIHWAQDRIYTIEEVREIQGIPSSEVIIGSMSAQMRMIGNAVDRHISEQLGLALRHAFEKSLGPDLEEEQSDIVVDSYSGETFLDAPLPWLKDKAGLITSTLQNRFARKSAGTLTPATNVSQETSDMPIFSDSSTTSEEIHRAWLSKVVLAPTNTLPMLPTKRAYEEEVEVEVEVEVQTKLSNFERNNPEPKARKRSKRDQKPRHATNSFTPESADREDSRRTRNSGLGVEFTPKAWHRKPETLAKEEEKRDRRPYA